MTEKETEVGTMFHSVSFLFARCFQTNTLFSNKRCQRQTGVFTMFHLVQIFVARCCKMQCVCAAQNNLKGY